MIQQIASQNEPPGNHDAVREAAPCERGNICARSVLMCVHIHIYIHTHIEVDRYRYASPNTCSYLWLSMYIFILYFTHCIPLTKRLQWHQSWRVLGTSWSCSSPDRLTAATSSTAADSWWNQSGLFKTFTWDSHLKLGIDKLYKRSATLL